MTSIQALDALIALLDGTLLREDILDILSNLTKEQLQALIQELGQERQALRDMYEGIRGFSNDERDWLALHYLYRGQDEDILTLLVVVARVLKERKEQET